MNHSPAPWSVHPYTQVVGELHECPEVDGSPSFMAAQVFIGSGMTLIAEFKHYSRAAGYPSPTLDEMHANARLAIAAPELLEALEAVVRRAENPALCDDTDALLRNARSAIAKAKGQA